MATRMQTSRSSLPVFCGILGLLAFGAKPALASIALTGHVGGGVGTLTKEGSALKTSGYAYGFAFTWNPEFGQKPFPLSLGLTGKQSKFGYSEDHINKRATHNLVGPSLGLNLPTSDLFSVQIFANYYPSAPLTVLSTNSVRLNDSNFKYATWESFDGSGAVEGRINFTHDKIDGQFSKKNRFRTGVGVSYLQQQFNSHRTEISTSKDSLTPTTTVSTDKVKNSLINITVDFYIGLTF